MQKREVEKKLKVFEYRQNCDMILRRHWKATNNQEKRNSDINLIFG